MESFKKAAHLGKVNRKQKGQRNFVFIQLAFRAHVNEIKKPVTYQHQNKPFNSIVFDRLRVDSEKK